MMKKLMFSMMGLMVIAGSNLVAMKKSNRHVGFIGVGQSSSIAAGDNEGSYNSRQSASAGAESVSHQGKRKAMHSETARVTDAQKKLKNGFKTTHVERTVSKDAASDSSEDRRSYANSSSDNNATGSYNGGYVTAQQEAGVVAVGSSTSD